MFKLFKEFKSKKARFHRGGVLKKLIPFITIFFFIFTLFSLKNDHFSQSLNNGSIKIHDRINSTPPSLTPLTVWGYTYIEGGDSANLGINITGHDLTSGEQEATQTVLMAGNLIGYTFELNEWDPGNTLVVKASDYSPSTGSYQAERTVTLPNGTDTFQVDLTLFFNSKPTISSLTYNSTNVFEEDYVSFELGAMDDEDITEAKVFINQSVYQMQLVAGEPENGNWRYTHQFTDAGSYIIYAFVYDSVQSSVKTNQIILQVMVDGPPTLVLSANNTQLDLNEPVRFLIELYEDKELTNFQLFIGLDNVTTPALLSGEELNGVYFQDWIFNDSGIIYCYAVASDLKTTVESNQVTIASNTTAVPPIVLNIAVNATIVETTDTLNFTAEIWDNNEIVNVFLVGQEINLTMSQLSGNVSMGIWSCSLSGLESGNYDFRIYAVDEDSIRSGNSSGILITVLLPDQLPAILKITPESKKIITTRNTEISFLLSIMDDRGISLVYFYIEGLPTRLNLENGTSKLGNWSITRFFDIPGTFNVYFKVWDTSNHETIYELTIIVDERPTLGMLQTDSTSILQYQEISFRIVATDDFNVTSVNLYFDNNFYPLSIISGNEKSATWGRSLKFNESGAFIVYAIANDNNSRNSLFSNQLTIGILPDERPQIELLRGSNLKAETNQKIEFVVSVIDDVEVVGVKLFINDLTYEMAIFQGNITSSTWKFNTSFEEAGEYTVTAQAYDNVGQTSDVSNVFVIFISPALSTKTDGGITTSDPNAPFAIELFPVSLVFLVFLKRLTIVNRRRKNKR